MVDYYYIRRALLTMAMLCAWPFLSFLNNNQEDVLIYGGVIIIYALAFVAVVGASVALSTVIFGRKYCVSFAHIGGVASVCLFLYLPLSSFIASFGVSLGWVRIALWLGLTLAILIGIWKLSIWRQTGLVLAVMSFSMVLMPALGLAYFAMTGIVKHDRIGITARDQSIASNSSNVYWFIFDAYPRTDVLRDYFGYDNDEFVKALFAREFLVSEKSTSNYVSTKFSLSTAASMEYYLPTEISLHPAMWTARLQGFSPVVEKFKSLGYRYTHVESGGNNLKTRCGGAEDRCIKAKTLGTFGINEAEVGLLGLTPLYPIIRRIFPQLISFDFTSVEEVIEQLDFASPIPQFVFAHILSPHPPKRFDEKCNPMAPEKFELYGRDYSGVIRSYLNDLRCLNPLILNLVDEIVTSDRSGPYIIIQSDHGFRGKRLKSHVQKPSVGPEFVGFANFSAMRVPETCEWGGDQHLSPVNTFRVVLSCIEGTELAMLPNRHFVSKGGKLKEVYFEDF